MFNPSLWLAANVVIILEHNHCRGAQDEVGDFGKAWFCDQMKGLNLVDEGGVEQMERI